MSETKRFSRREVKRLQEELGVSEGDAILIASQTMSGAHVNRFGNIDAFQTQCNVVKYPESLPPSQGAKEGGKVTRGLLGGLFGRKIKSDKDADKAVDEWMEKKIKSEEKKKKKR